MTLSSAIKKKLEFYFLIVINNRQDSLGEQAMIDLMHWVSSTWVTMFSYLASYGNFRKGMVPAI